MTNVVDIRPDHFLRALRECGDYTKSCETAGISAQDIHNLMLENSKFDLAVINAHMEWIEESLMSDARKAVESLRDYHMEGFKVRHPDG